ncbi:MAG: MMPL family transporter [Jatrophihabitans sp.]|uniref:MMPL family transporter n=1 Tax=Jatrophihabitans sp. TaxID=1932789 RepID=UPI003F7D5D26
MRSLARLAIRHSWLVVAGWVAFLVLTNALAAAAGGSAYKDSFALPHTESGTVLDLLRNAGQGASAGQSGTVVLHPASGALDPATPPDGLLPALSALCPAGLHVAGATSPWGGVACTPTGATPTPRAPGGSPLLSTDRSVGLVTIAWQYNENAVQNFSGVHDRLAKLATPQLQVEFTGPAFANLAARGGGGVPPELFGFVAALVILTVVFRTVGAAALPLLSAAAALGSGLALISLLSHAMNVASFSTQLAQLMVIGVGVDYALFIVTRHRRNVLHGMPLHESIENAINTSGRAVLFAGATVCIAMLGLTALGVSFLYGVAIGTAIAVALTMVASLTLLPAVLRLLGYKVLPRRVRAQVKAGTYVVSDRPTRWARWARLVSHRKLGLGLVAGAVIVVLAIPFFSLRLGRADESNDPPGSTTYRGYELIANAPGFGPGYNSTLELVVDGPGASDRAFLAAATTGLRGVSDVNPTSIRPVPLSPTLALITFKSTSSPQAEATTNLVTRLRHDLAPRLEHGTTTQVYVFGQTAIFVDFAAVLASKIAFFFAAIIGLSFLLLMVAFRSVLIPLSAAVMNLFAAGASFGVLVAVFQWGWGHSLLGIGKGGPVDAFLPVLFFAILFGLSMDYQVFLVSRMHEEWVHTRENGHSVRVGQAETGGIITAAALIMIAVFLGFLFGDARVIKMVGLGLGGAIFLDAFVLRTVLVPALMHALGRANWWYPRWLDRITPQLSVEAPGAEWERGTDLDAEPEPAGV